MREKNVKGTCGTHKRNKKLLTKFWSRPEGQNLKEKGVDEGIILNGP